MNRHSEKSLESAFQFKLNLIIKNSRRESLFHDQNRGKYSKSGRQARGKWKRQKVTLKEEIMLM